MASKQRQPQPSTCGTRRHRMHLSPSRLPTFLSRRRMLPEHVSPEAILAFARPPNTSEPYARTMPFIPGPDGHTISQIQMTQMFRNSIQLTGATMEGPGPAGEPRPRFSRISAESPEDSSSQGWDTYPKQSNSSADGDPMQSNATSKTHRQPTNTDS